MRALGLLKSVISMLVVLIIPLKAQTTSGKITKDETWSGQVLITGDVTVTKGMLTISPGTVVKFDTTSDNVEEGDSNHIWLTVRGQGIIRAVGTEYNQITFTTNADSAVPGSWGGIRIDGIINDAQNVFQYCNVFYSLEGFALENIRTLGEVSAPRIEWCEIAYTSRSGIYCTDGAEPLIDNCRIRNTESTVFLNGAGSVKVQYSYLYDSENGIIIVGNKSSQVETVTVNHITMHNVNCTFSRDSLFCGRGLVTSNDTTVLVLTNSIISKVTFGVIVVSKGWTILNDYNCWDIDSILGLDTLGPNSFEQDPLFLNAANHDFSLQPLSSPCWGQASDHYQHIGAWQSGGTSLYRQTPGLLKPNKYIRVTPQPSPGKVVISVPADLAGPDRYTAAIYNIHGQLVCTLVSDGNRIIWDGYNTSGIKVKEGIYFCQIRVGKTVCQERIIMTR